MNTYPSIDALRSAAVRGEPAAQEMFAGWLDSTGHADAAVQWLEKAAATGRASAEIRLGLFQVVGRGTPSDPAKGVARILTVAKTGNIEAAHLLATLIAGGVGTPRDSTQAITWLCAAARAGHARAACELGLLLRFASPLAHEALTLLAQAANAGFAPAQYALGKAVEGSVAGQALIANAALNGDPCAVKYRRPSGTPSSEEMPASREVVWARLVDAIDPASFWPTPLRRTVCDRPRIELIERFLPGWACDYVMGMAAPALQRGLVVDRTGGESVSAERTNSVMNFGLADSDVLLEFINHRIAQAIGMAAENAEGLGVLHYAPGQSYRAHADWIDPNNPRNASQLAERGQRVRTFIIYLNDDFEDGQTHFMHLNLKLRPARGGAIHFANVDEAGAVEPRAIHAGLSPSGGEKWVISKWFRTKALRPASEAMK